MLTILYYIIAGAIIGGLARLILPGKQDLSLLLTIGLGIVGMVLGGIVGQFIPPDNQGVPWILGTVCAVAVLFVVTRTNLLGRA